MHALYYTDKVCSEPLTPLLHLSDMRQSVKGYTEMVARVLKAWAQAMDQLGVYYRQYSAGGPTLPSNGEHARYFLFNATLVHDVQRVWGLTLVVMDRFPVKAGAQRDVRRLAMGLPYMIADDSR